MKTVTMTLARALKEKNRVAGRLAIVRGRIHRLNSWEEDIAPREGDVQALDAEASQLQQRLIAIKSAIAVANVKIAEKLISLSETKSEIEYVKGIPTKAGTFIDVTYGGAHITHTFTTVLSNQAVIQRCEELQAKIEQLQDEIDEYNALTQVEIPVAD